MQPEREHPATAADGDGAKSRGDRDESILQPAHDVLADRLFRSSGDAQRDAVYDAEGAAHELLAFELDDLDQLDADELGPWIRGVLGRGGWGTGSDTVPPFALDVPDDGEVAGWHEASTGIIHLHPRLLDPWTVLHEVAHWLRPLDGHGPQFCGALLSMVGAGIGLQAAYELREAFHDFDVEVDLTWCDELALEVAP